MNYDELHKEIAWCFYGEGRGIPFSQWLELGQEELYEPVLLQFARIESILRRFKAGLIGDLDDVFVINEEGLVVCSKRRSIVFCNKQDTIYRGLCELQKRYEKVEALESFFWLLKLTENNFKVRL